MDSFEFEVSIRFASFSCYKTDDAMSDQSLAVLQ